MSAGLLRSELSRFLLETKVRNGDQVVGLMITDRYGGWSSEPDRYLFGDEPWWHDIHRVVADQVYTSAIAKRSSVW